MVGSAYGRRAWGWCSVAAIVGVVTCLHAAAPASAQPSTSPVEASNPPPLTLEVLAPPQAVTGSDGDRHLVYELMLTNITPVALYVTDVQVVDPVTERVLAEYRRDAIPPRLLVDPQQPRSSRLMPDQLGFFFVHAVFPPQATLPGSLTHRVIVTPVSENVPWTASGADTAVNQEAPVVLGPPLQGSGYIAGDGCCDAPRHVQAVMPDGQGNWWNAQRFAIDWELLDAQNHLWVAPPERKESPQVGDYLIYGQDILAVADGTVVAVVKNLPDQPPGKMPDGLPRDEADGNHVILELRQGAYALYAHMAPGSVAVDLNQPVKKGQVLGKVGNSGNTSAPHLHFQLMDRPSSLDANGLPYVVEQFRINGFDPNGSDDFQAAEDHGTPATITPVTPPSAHANQLPLNVTVVDWMN